jgi:AcrR family transcriptional regulator
VCICTGVTRRRPSPARDSLLAAAGRLTYERGIAATGVDAIAAEAGVTKRTLYQHFRSKDALLAASLGARDAPAIETLRDGARRRALETGEPAVLALFDQIEHALAGSAPNGCAFLNATLELGRPDHPAHQAALAHLQARERLVGELLAADQIDDPELASQLALLVDGALAVGGSRRDPTAAQRAKRAARALLKRHAHR